MEVVSPRTLLNNSTEDDVSTAAPSPRSRRTSLGELECPKTPYVKKRVASHMEKTSGLHDAILGETVSLDFMPLTCHGVSPEEESFAEDRFFEGESFEVAEMPDTPHQKHSPMRSTPPGAPKMQRMPLLMRALQKNSTELVQDAIQAEPDVARFPFWDHEIEPPLCFAVRRKCKPEIIELLLLHGADRDSKDRQGRSPADILRSMRTIGRAAYPDIGMIAKLLHVPQDELGTVQTTTPWQIGAVYMFGPLDWRMLDMKSRDWSVNFDYQGFRPMLQVAWFGA